ncbi:hypothetical protein BDR04DRAFT_1116489 [Suillus decipiens]|nr:hypothetical protein BDR04DRAFT_1116489 [Suillus decipiens]
MSQILLRSSWLLAFAVMCPLSPPPPEHSLGIPSAICFTKDPCRKFDLNGIYEPFWLDWPLSDPSWFMTPEPLHHWHHMFWDHNLNWCIIIVSADELDFYFMLLQVFIGYHGFKDGISTLKQVSGRDHQDVQQYLVGLVAAAVPSDFLSTVCSLCEFRYLVQAPCFIKGAVAKVEHALQDFHTRKEAIVNAGAQQGKSGKNKLWAIPKLELLQGVVPSIHSHRSVMQWSADPMEHVHIDYVKVPGHAGNNHNYDEQVCHYLDRQEKCQKFALALEIKLGKGLDEEDEDAGNVNKAGGACHFKDYFEQAQQLIESGHDAPCPFQTFAMPITAYHLSNNPTLTHMTIDKAVERFALHDLCAALVDYLECDAAGSIHVIGGRRRAPSNCKLHFECIQVWCKVCMQLKSYHEQCLEPSQAVLAQPPSKTWPCRQYDVVIMNIDPMFKWPHSHLEGHCVSILCLVFRPITPLEHSGTYLAYVEHLGVVAWTQLQGCMF